VNLYSQEYQRTKKEIERREKLEIGTLDDSLMDLSIYQSPTRNAKKFYDPATIGRINSPGIFNFEVEEDSVESSRIVDKNNGHATPIRRRFMRRHSSAKDIEDEKKTSDDFKASTVAANPFRRLFGRRQSLTTAKDIEHLRPGMMHGTAFDNDGDDDDDDEDNDGDDEEAVSKPIHNMRPGMIRGRSYVENSPQPESSTPSINSVRPGRRRGTAFDNDGDDDDDDDDEDNDGDDEEAVSKPIHNMRPGMIRGRSYVENSPHPESSTPSINSLRPGRRRGTAIDNDGDDEEVVSKPVHNMRPGMVRGRSYVEESLRPESSTPSIINTRGSSFDGDDYDKPEKHQQVKDAEEKSIKLLDQDQRQEKAPVYLKACSSLRKGYMNAVDKLRPQSKSLLVQTKDDRKKESSKVKKCDDLKNAWDIDEDTAQDKPDPEDFSPEERAAEEKEIEVETAVNRDWLEYAEEVVKVVQNGDSSDEGDHKCDFWRSNMLKAARRLEAEAEIKKAKEEKKREKSDKKKRNKEEEAQQKRLEAEHGNSVLLKEETRKKKKIERKAKSSKTKEINLDSTDTENVGKAESGVDEEKRKRRKEERRQKREAAKSNDTSGEDVKEIVVGTSNDARRRQLAFSWYSKMSEPDRSEFKRKVKALHSLNITPDDVDLLPWNATGSAVNIAEMNTLLRPAS
jgi:hypothetical protein